MTHYILTISNYLQSPISEATNFIIKVYTTLRNASNKHRIYSSTLKELNRLSDKELTDIGLHKGDIENIARQTAYGKIFN